MAGKPGRCMNVMEQEMPEGFVAAEALPAATVVLLRDAEDGIEVLLLRRNSKLRFAAGAWVFPGGKVDQDDSPHHAADAQETARHAAVREAAEEAQVQLDVSQLVVISHWTTPLISPRRFATWFFVATVESGQPIVVDGSEILEHRWLTPRQALEAYQSDQMPMIVPTYVTLQELLTFNDGEQTLAHYRGKEPVIWPVNYGVRRAEPQPLGPAD